MCEVNLDPVDPQVRLDPLECRVHLVRLEHLDHLEHQEFPDSLASSNDKDLKTCFTMILLISIVEAYC